MQKDESKNKQNSVETVSSLRSTVSTALHCFTVHLLPQARGVAREWLEMPDDG